MPRKPRKFSKNIKPDDKFEPVRAFIRAGGTYQEIADATDVDFTKIFKWVGKPFPAEHVAQYLRDSDKIVAYCSNRSPKRTAVTPSTNSNSNQPETQCR